MKENISKFVILKVRVFAACRFAFHSSFRLRVKSIRLRLKSIRLPIRIKYRTQETSQ